MRGHVSLVRNVLQAFTQICNHVDHTEKEREGEREMKENVDMEKSAEKK